jgi:hypothetical protein
MLCPLSLRDFPHKGKEKGMVVFVNSAFISVASLDF